MRRHGYEKMQVVFGNVALDNFNIHGLADLPDLVSHPNRYLSREHGLAVFRDPHHVEFDVLNSVRGLAVVFHNTASLLKSSPKGEGFSPIPRGGTLIRVKCYIYFESLTDKAVSLPRAVSSRRSLLAWA